MNTLSEYAYKNGQQDEPDLPMAGGKTVEPDTTTVAGELPGAPAVGFDTKGWGGLVGSIAGGVANAATKGHATGVGPAVGGLVDGKPAEDIAVDVLGAFSQRALAEVIGGLDLGPAARALGPAIGLTKEAFKEDPNYGAAALAAGLPAAASAIGSMFGPLGAMGAGMLADFATKASLKDGWLGDITDARSHEAKRERVEKMGYSYGNTKDMAEQENSKLGGVKGTSGYSVSPSLSNVDEGSPFGQMSQSAQGVFDDSPQQSAISTAAQNALGDPKSLSSFASNIDLSDLESPGSGTGTGGAVGGGSVSSPDPDKGSDIW